VLILRLDCPEGYQQYWALIPPESGLVSEDKKNRTTSTSTFSASASAVMEHKHSRGGSGGSNSGGGDVGSLINLESGPSMGPGSLDASESALHMVRSEI
jgi:hypothetical protein